MTETWLKETSVPPILNHYTFIQEIRKGRCGGGVGIYTHSSLHFVTRQDLHCNRDILESIFLEIERTDAQNIIVGCIYRPPEGSIFQCIEELECLFEKL